MQDADQTPDPEEDEKSSPLIVPGEGACERESVCKRGRVCVCVREREKERVCGVCEREIESKRKRPGTRPGGG